MEMKAEYKHTEVGTIPRDWEVATVGTLLESGELGGNYSNEAKQTSYPLIKMGNLDRGKFNLDKVEYVPEDRPPDPVHRLKPGDLLFNTRNTPQLVGKVALWREELHEAYFNSNLMRLEFDARRIASSEFANYALNAQYALKQLRNMVTATTSVAAIYRRDLERLKLALPPIPEQRAIADALSDVDALIERLDALIAKKRDIKKATMQRLLTGRQRLPGFSEPWRTKRLGEVVSKRNERVSPNAQNHGQFCVELEHVGQGTGSLTGNTRTTSNSSAKAVFEEGDVLFAKLRSYLRKYWLADRSGVCSTEIWVLTTEPGTVLPSFLYHYVTRDGFIEAASKAHGTHMPRADWKVVKDFQLDLPPTDEQRAIAKLLSDMDAEVEVLQARRYKTQDIKQGMMQELLTGCTRLV